MLGLGIGDPGGAPTGKRSELDKSESAMYMYTYIADSGEKPEYAYDKDMD